MALLCPFCGSAFNEGETNMLLSLAIKLGKVDKTFFLICLGIIAVGVLIYFLIPVINRKQYKEQRENLEKREAAFRANRPADSDKK